MKCLASITGKHCDCWQAVASDTCCYCGKKIHPAAVTPEYDDDGSEENRDA